MEKCQVPLADLFQQAHQELGLVEEVRQVPQRLAELRRRGPAGRALLVTNAKRFQTLSVVVGTLQEARSFWQTDPRHAEEWVRLAFVILQKIMSREDVRYPEFVVADYWGRALTYLGHTLHIRSSLDAADAAFTFAEAWLTYGTHDSMESALLAWYRSLLARDRRQFDEAEKLTITARDQYWQLGHVAEVAGLEVSLAIIKLYAGKTAAAKNLLEDFFVRYDRRSIDRQTYASALEAYCLALCEEGEYEEGLRSLQEAREVAGQSRKAIASDRHDWLQARLEHGLGNAREAEELYRQVLASFLVYDIAFDAALVALDLAVLLLEQGQFGEAGGLAKEMIPIFDSHDIHREAQAAGLVLVQALEAETASPKLVKDVARYLRLARNDPSFRYRPPQGMSAD